MDDQPRTSEQGDEIIITPARDYLYRRIRFVGWFVTLPLVVSHCVFNTILPQVFESNFLDTILPESVFVTIAFVMVGICMVQVDLIAVLAAFSPGNLVNRIPIAVVLGVLMWSSLVLGNRIVGSVGGEVVYTLGVLIGVGITVASIPLAVASWLRGWQLVAPGDVANRDDRFSVRNMMFAIAVLAVAMAMSRLLIPKNQPMNTMLDYQLCAFVAMLALANLVVIVPGVWVSFLSGEAFRVWLSIWLVGLCLVGLILGCGCMAILGGPTWVILSMMAMLMAQGFTLVGTLWLLRMVGYRLVRR